VTPIQNHTRDEVRNAREGSEGLFKAAEIARAENQKRESEHQQQRHHDLNQNKSIRRHII
jgi:hypothetical protein